MQLKAPEGIKSVAVGGTQYSVDRLGVVEVPAEAVEQFVGHGFTPYFPPAPEVKAAEEEKPETSEEEKPGKRPYHKR